MHQDTKRVTTEASPRTNTQLCSETSQDTVSCQAEGSVLHRFSATHLHVRTVPPPTLGRVKMLPSVQKLKWLDALTSPVRLICVTERQLLILSRKKIPHIHTGHVDVSILRKISGGWFCVWRKAKGKWCKTPNLCEGVVSRAGLRVCRAAETAWRWDYTWETYTCQ